MRVERIKRFKNMTDTDEACTCCGAWIKHWSNFTGKPESVTCANNACGRQADDGAHVEFENGYTGILPLCDNCNHPTNVDWMETIETEAPIKQCSTCGNYKSFDEQIGEIVDGLLGDSNQ